MIRAMGRLAGKVIAITGASAGIGRATAERCAAEGAAVVLSARRGDRLDEIAVGITARGGRAIAVPGDVTRPEDMRALVVRAVEAFGRLDVMICNAGLGFHGPLAETTPEIVQRLFDVNVLGTISAARAAHDVFVTQGSGHIIAVSSIAGRRGVSGNCAYSATKAAQIGFIEGLRAEFLGTGLHASVVYPISTRTEFRDAMQREFGRTASGVGPRQDADRVAAAIADCIARPRPEVYPYRPAKLLAILAVVAPGWTDRLVQRYRRGRADGSK